MKNQKISHLKTAPTREWHIIDGSSKTLGRLASEIASLLRGKHKRTFSPHIDMGDFVVVTNIENLKLTGRKLTQKVYYRHSGYLGGLKSEKLEQLIQNKPEEVVKRAVFSMLDEVKFRKTMISRLKLVKGTEHKFSQVKS